MSTKAAPFCTAVALLAIVSCCPVITRIAPEQGRYGTEVVISGERFEDAPSDNTVTFGGVSVPTPDILQASSTMLKVKVPAGAQSGAVRVSTGYCDAASPEQFTVPNAADRPDLVPKKLSVDSNGMLSFEIKNEGRTAVPPGPGKVSVFVDGKLLRTYTLDNLSDQSFRDPGGITRLDTDLRMAGRNRRIAAVMVSTNLPGHIFQPPNAPKWSRQ